MIRGQWSEEYQTVIFWEQYWIVAYSGKEAYLHFYDLGDDCEKAERLLERMCAASDFTPEGKPGVWLPIRDTTEQRPRRRKLLWWLGGK